MTDEEIWSGYLVGAQAQLAAAAPASVASGIVGRSIVKMVAVLTRFWQAHKATLIPHLTSLAIAALDAVASQAANIATVDPPGPQ
jgi:hypothetical protein